MAGKAKSIYLTILPKGKHVSVFKKVFFEAKSYNEYVKTDEFKAKWPADQFDIVKETYFLMTRGINCNFGHNLLVIK